MQQLYLDYNATTPVDANVLAAMMPYFSENFGNAASSTHLFGRASKSALDIARQQTASALGCLPQEIYFTSGATETINLALKGIYFNYQNKGNHIVTTTTEHKAVLDTCAYLEKYHGALVTYLAVDRLGLIDLEELKNSITDKTVVVAIQYANNETGTVMPIKQIADIVHAKGCILFSDTTQVVGKKLLNIEEEGIDCCCISAHKFYGPKGVGAIYVRRKNPRVILQPQIHGGGHENGLRSGTQNVTGIVGLGAAIELAQEEVWNYAQHTSKLRTKLEHVLIDNLHATINGNIKDRLPNTTSVTFDKINAQQFISNFPFVAVATGSACTSVLNEPSHVLLAMGLSEKQAKSTVRFSLGKYTTVAEINNLINRLKEKLDN